MNLDAYRLAKQNDLSAIDYHDMMMDNIDDFDRQAFEGFEGN